MKTSTKLVLIVIGTALLTAGLCGGIATVLHYTKRPVQQAIAQPLKAVAEADPMHDKCMELASNSQNIGYLEGWEAGWSQRHALASGKFTNMAQAIEESRRTQSNYFNRVETKP